MSLIPTAEQAPILSAVNHQQHLKVNASAGTGKALRNDQPVLTATGYRPIGDLSVGDEVIGGDGQPTTVLGVYPQGVRPLFAVTFSDQTVVIADAEHRWKVFSAGSRLNGGPGVVKTTAELAQNPRAPAGDVAHSRWGDGTRSRWFLPMTAPVHFAPSPASERPIDPWLLGVLLGDGGMSSGALMLTTPDEPLLDAVRLLIAPLGMSINHRDHYDYRLVGSPGRHPGFRGQRFNPLMQFLMALHLRGTHSYDKFIPIPYRYAPPEDRLALLQGLFDTDGSAGPSSVEYTTSSPQMAIEVQAMVHSLGGTAVLSVHSTVCRPSYRLYIKLPVGMAPFRLPRKLQALKPNQRPPYRSLRSIEPVDPGEATCLEVASQDHLFLTAGCAPTHNTSLIKMIAEAHPDWRILYVCFTKPIQRHAERVMPENVTCRTQHALAHRVLDIRGAYGDRVGQEVWVSTVRDRLKLADSRQALVVRQTLENYCTSADRWIEGRHVPAEAVYALPQAQRADFVDQMLDAARRLWTLIVNPKEREFGLPHGVYLKQWQAMEGAPLDKPYHLIAGDEFQDFSPVQFDAFSRHPGRQLVIGDRCQPSGTQVSVVTLTAQGLQMASRPIETLQLGDAVLAMGLTDPSPAIARLTGISQRQYTGDLVVIETQGGYRSRYVPQHHAIIGEGADRRILPAEDLHVGQWVCSLAGWVTITAISREAYAGVVWSLNVEDQHTYFGDGLWTANCQKIFNWRWDKYAPRHDAMAQFVATADYPLTHSHRFGPALAALANQLLSLTANPPPPLVGIGPPTVVGREPLTPPFTWLFRTNLAMLLEAVKTLRSGRRIHVIGGLSEACNLLEGSWLLYQGHPEKVVTASLRMLGSWPALVEASDYQPEFRLAVQHVRQLGGEIPQLVREVREAGEAPEPEAEVVFSTVHKFKGRQAKRVQVYPDFEELAGYSPTKGRYWVNEDVVHLVYVAITRAQEHLSIGAPLTYLNDWRALLTPARPLGRT